MTVLEDRAAVTRRGTIAIAAGQHRIAIERVSPVIVDKTLIATATGGRVLDVRCERYLAPWRAAEGGTRVDDLALALQTERQLPRALAVALADGDATAARAEVDAVAQVTCRRAA